MQAHSEIKNKFFHNILVDSLEAITDNDLILVIMVVINFTVDNTCRFIY